MKRSVFIVLWVAKVNMFVKLYKQSGILLYKLLFKNMQLSLDPDESLIKFMGIISTLHKGKRCIFMIGVQIKALMSLI
jgi:hypothetical protein